MYHSRTEEEEEGEEERKPSATSSCMQAGKKRQIVKQHARIHAPETVVVKELKPHKTLNPCKNQTPRKGVMTLYS